MKKQQRHWQILICLDWWQLYIDRHYGRNSFLKETWVGPIVYRRWSNPKSAGKAFSIW